MTVSRQALDRFSGETGFRPDTLEKVIRLGELAADIGRQPKPRCGVASIGSGADNLTARAGADSNGPRRPLPGDDRGRVGG